MTNTSKVSFLPWLRMGISNKIGIADKFLYTNAAPLTKPRVELNVDLNLSITKGSTVDTSKKATKTVEIIGPGDILAVNPQEIKSTKPVFGESEFEFNHLAFIEFNSPDFPWRFTPSSPTKDPNDAAAIAAMRPWVTLVVLKANEFTRLAYNGISSPIRLTTEGEQYGVFPPHDQMWAWGHVQVNEDITDGAGSLSELQNIINTNPSNAFSRLICPRRLEKNTQYFAFLIPTFENGRKIGLGQEVLSTFGGLDPAWKYTTSTPISLDKTGVTFFEFPVYYEWTFRTSEQSGFEEMARRIKPKTVENFKSEMLCLSNAHPLLKGKLPVKTDPDTDLPSILQPIGANGFKKWHFTYNQFVDGLLDLLNKPEDILQTPSASNHDPIITPPIYGKWHALKTSLTQPSESDNDWLHELNLDPRYRAMAGLGAEVVRTNQEEYMKKAWEDIDRVMAANRVLSSLQVAQQVQNNQYRNRISSASSSQLIVYVGENTHKNVIGTSGKSIHYDFKNSNLPKGIFEGRFRALMAPGGILAKGFSQSDPVAEISNWFEEINNESASFAGPYQTPTGMQPLTVLSSTQMTASYVINTISSKDDFILTKPGLSSASFSSGNDNIFASYLRDQLSQINQDGFAFINSMTPPLSPDPLDINIVANDIFVGINPMTCFADKANKIFSLVEADSKAAYSLSTIDKVLAAPIINAPLSIPLYEKSPDFIVPNLADVLKNNSTTVFETNNKALEAFMVGANVEMAKELLWRGYPTDQRGTYFRNFWCNSNPDIKEIHQWIDGNNLSELGANKVDGSSTNCLIIAIRGDLLTKFPNPIVFMKKANNSTGPLTPSTLASDVKLPSFYARFGSDTLFVGFNDMTVDLALNDLGGKGWFFTIKETPTGMRFGLDEFDASINFSNNLINWNYLNWGNLSNINQAKLIELTGNIVPNNQNYGAYWKKSSADMASILYKAQSEIAIHAKLLLTN